MYMDSKSKSNFGSLDEKEFYIFILFYEAGKTANSTAARTREIDWAR
jgi:hypothetical protein